MTGNSGREQTAQVGHGDRRRKKSKTSERCSYQTRHIGHVHLDQRRG